jgi:hypothetical protein
MTTKFSVKPKPDAPLVTPHGAAKVLYDFLDRVSELQYMIDTQDKELATTRAELAANGLTGISFSNEDAPDIAEDDSTPYVIPTALVRRIEWEKYLFACGPVHTARFAKHTDDTLGIQYRGPSKNNEFRLNMRQRVKALWLATHDRLPTVEEVTDNKNFNAYYKTPVLAYGEPKHEGDEDPDPYRDHFHSDFLQPCTHASCEDRGYAGPRGTLGLDMDEEPEPGDILDDEEDDA